MGFEMIRTERRAAYGFQNGTGDAINVRMLPERTEHDRGVWAYDIYVGGELLIREKLYSAEGVSINAWLGLETLAAMLVADAHRFAEYGGPRPKHVEDYTFTLPVAQWAHANVDELSQLAATKSETERS